MIKKKKVRVFSRVFLLRIPPTREYEKYRDDLILL